MTSRSIKVKRFSLLLHETNGKFVWILFDISSSISLSEHRVIHDSELVFSFGAVRIIAVVEIMESLPGSILLLLRILE